MSEKPDPLIGRTIASKYLIEERIGQGGMGSVYRTRHLVTGKPLAIKVLLEDLAAYDSFVQRFLHEARAAAFLTNPHVINILDCGREGDVVYLLMEYLQGHTLHQLIKLEGPFGPTRAARILGQICSALADAHAHGIIHRDLKPDNVMLRQVEGERDYVKVLDFGIAKVLDEQGAVKLPASRNLFIGTPEYASPEQCNSKPPTPLSDIYSLGIILFEMLTGRPPFQGEPMQVMMQHASQPPPTLREAGLNTSADIEAVVARALEKDPARRIPSALQLAGDFQAAANHHRRNSREITAGRRPSAEPNLPGGMTGQVEAARRSPVPVRTFYPTPSLQRPGKLRIALFGFVLIFVLAGILSAGYIGYQFLSWYNSTPRPPAPPGTTPPPAAETTDDPLVAVRGMFDQGNRDGALQRLREITARSAGGDPGARTLMGAILVDQGDMEGAAEQFRLALEVSDGRYTEARYQAGLLKRDQGDLDGALAELQAAGRESDHLGIQVALAQLYAERGEREEAQRSLTRVSNRTSEDPESMLLIAEAFGLLDDVDRALQETRRAIDLRGEVYPEGHYKLGMLLLQRGNLSDAISSLHRASDQRSGNYPAARFGLGVALSKHGDAQAAVIELRAAIRHRGGNYPAAELALAQTLAQPSIAAYDEADRMLESAIRHRSGRYPEARELQGTLAFFRHGRLESARNAWQESGTERSEEFLRATADAFPLQAGSEESGSSLGDAPLPENSTLSFNFAVWPEPRRVAFLRFSIGDAALLLQMEAATDAPPKVTAFRMLGTDRQFLQAPPAEVLFSPTGAARLTARVEAGSMEFLINDREVCRFPGRPGESLRVTLKDAGAILFQFQTARTSKR
ncbi:MAG: protein kinase [Acidobacteria bacterium]|nr:protein kinase [Acidobacteriota bacterium]